MGHADEALGTDTFVHMWRLVSRESHPRYFQEFADIEREASLLRVFEPLAIPGLLQSDDYARALLSSTPGATEEQVEALVAARAERRAVLDSENAPTLVALIYEPVLSCPVGGREVMRAQLDALLEAAKSPKVILQVVPASSTAVAGLAGAFTIASMDGAEVAYFETVATGHLIDRAEDVAECVAFFEAARGEALSSRDSLELIRRRRDEL